MTYHSRRFQGKLGRRGITRRACYLRRLHTASLPAHWGMFAITDDTRHPTEALLNRLPHGMRVILRDYDTPNRPHHLLCMARLAKRRGMRLYVAEAPSLPATLTRHRHLPQFRLQRRPLRRPVATEAGFSAAAHSLPAILRAHAAGAEVILLSPLFATPSGTEKQPLGRWHFLRLLQAAPPAARKKLVALGGLNEKTLARCRSLPVAGIAGLSLYKFLTPVAHLPQRG